MKANLNDYPQAQNSHHMLRTYRMGTANGNPNFKNMPTAFPGGSSASLGGSVRIQNLK